MFIEGENKDVMTKANNPFTVINYNREVAATEIAEYLSDGDINAELFYRKVIPQVEFEALVLAERQATEAAAEAQA